MPRRKLGPPRNQKTGRATLVWNNGTANRMNNLLAQKQKIVDSEVLRRCSPLVPFRTGTLERSGTIGTVIGSGEVKYTTPYARKQYYDTAQTRSYDSRRGGRWFERMKAANKKDIEKMIND